MIGRVLINFIFFLAINLTWDRPVRFYKPDRSNFGISVLTKAGSLFPDADNIGKVICPGFHVKI